MPPSPSDQEEEPEAVIKQDNGNNNRLSADAVASLPLDSATTQPKNGGAVWERGGVNLARWKEQQASSSWKQKESTKPAVLLPSLAASASTSPRHNFSAAPSVQFSPSVDLLLSRQRNVESTVGTDVETGMGDVGGRGGSSEEDSLAEMEYMSETSNISEDINLASTVEDARVVTTGTSTSSTSLRQESLSSSDSPGSAARRTGSASKRMADNAYSSSEPETKAYAAATSSASVAPPRLPSLAAVSGRAGEASSQQHHDEHCPLTLPKFRDTSTCMWTASHAANCPSEDRSASLVNLLLQPLPPNFFDSETQLPPLEPDYTTLIRLNLWCVVDGHGGGCVATYASEVLLPHIAASVSRALGCAIVDRGVCNVNGQLRDANAVDLDGLITTSDRSKQNPNSIHYRSPYERSDSEEEEELEEGTTRRGMSRRELEDEDGNLSEVEGTVLPRTAVERQQISSLMKAGASMNNSDGGGDDRGASGDRAEASSVADASVSSGKTSVKTAASLANNKTLPGTHSPREVAAITRAITESFLAVDEGWINSIDPVATMQTSCQSNGRWNSGACALVVFTVQRLDWTSVSEPDREKESRGLDKSRRNTSQNRDAARRRMLDYASRTKSASSMSTVSSTSSLTTEEAVNQSGLESEITETEGEEDDRPFDADVRKRNPFRRSIRERFYQDKKESLISSPGGCSCHCYRAHDALLYTAHVGDCRAVALGSAPPRTIKVRGGHDGHDSSHQDTTDDESSHHSSDETECLSSSDHDADSSENEDIDVDVKGSATSAATSSYMNFPRRVARQRSSRRRGADNSSAGPYIALPPLDKDTDGQDAQFLFETDITRRERFRSAKDSSDSSASSMDSTDYLPLVHLPPVCRPIDLTTDHSAYNPAEVTAVLRRCNNAPRAISAGVGGGIKRVAGSLAVTRALGDAYLKTPLLSFLPYKRHAPYISARPEVNCRPLVKGSDKVLILATDGVWERTSGEDVLRWVRNFYEERVAEGERRNARRMNKVEKDKDKDKTSSNEDGDVDDTQQEGVESDLFFKNAPQKDAPQKEAADPNSRKRDNKERSPSPPAKRRKRSRPSRVSYNVADVIVRRVLNKVRRARNISSLQALMSLPQGRARRSKHDDITASVVDLSAFVS